MAGYKRIKQQLLGSGQLYKDEDFPATDQSVYYKRSPGDGWDSIVWKRPGEICENPQFFVDEASRFDLDQGSLGNCWFLSAAATLASKQKLFKKVVPLNQSFSDEYAGIFKFNFWQYGEWIEVLIDDRLPTKNNKLVFVHNKETPNEFWAALLEKAYAKLYGCYQALETGYSHDALVDFTGGIGEFIDLPEIPNKDKFFRTLRDSQNDNSLMAATIEVKPGDKFGEKLDNGLVKGHAYSITKVTQLNGTKFKQADAVVRLVRLYNPWGYREWTGSWGDQDPAWSTVPADIQQRLDLRKDNEGEFWMSFEDFAANFTSMQLCHLTPDSVQGGKSERVWKVVCHHGRWVRGVSAGGCGTPPHEADYWRNPQYYVRITDPDDEEETATLVVSLLQKYRRQARKALKSTTDLENPISFDLLKFIGEAPAELDGKNYDRTALRMQHKMNKYEYLRERSGRFVVAPGVYCIIPTMYEPDVEGDFLLRIATVKQAESGEVDTTTLAVPQEAEKPKKGNRFDAMFTKFAGDDVMVDSAELCKILNQGLKLGEEEKISKETCRVLISWALTPSGSGGTVDKKDTRKIWKEARRLKEVFEEYDTDDSFNLNRKEFKEAFKAIGFSVRKSTLGKVAEQYCGKQDALALDDFMRLAVRIANLHERQRSQPTDTPFDELLETALLT